MLMDNSKITDRMIEQERQRLEKKKKMESL